MGIQTSLYESQHVCLAPLDHEKDPEIVSRWTHDTEYLRLLSSQPARPLSVAGVKKKYEAIEKQVSEDKNLFYFTIRLREDDRLIGFAKIFWIEWSNGQGFLELGIGDPADRSKGYGNEVLELLMRFGFAELNLYRLTAMIPGYNEPAWRLFKKAGFVEEVRRRQALHREGQRWDLIHAGGEPFPRLSLLRRRSGDHAWLGSVQEMGARAAP